MSLSFQEIIFALNKYWAEQGCVILQPYDMEVGAGTFHPATFLASIGPEPTKSAYVQPSRRPTDGRYGDNPNRLQHYFQYQVVIKPSPTNFQDLYLDSIRQLGIDPLKDDIRFVEDDWESPTLGAWGLGWEVWLNGMEITQFTYFQQTGGLECRPVTGEITYGIERIAMYVQGIENVFDLRWNDDWNYGDLYLQNEAEQSAYNFEHADTESLLHHFNSLEEQCQKLAELQLAIPAYERVLQASHTFNLLDARKVIGVTERARYIARVRGMARLVAHTHFDVRKQKGFPRLKGESTEQMSTAPAASLQEHKVPAEFHTLPLLLELGTEELPPSSVSELGPSLLENLIEELTNTGLVDRNRLNSQDEWFATPRRVAVRLHEVRNRTSDEEVIKRGPPLNRAYDSEGNPTQAALGFARSCDVAVDDLEHIKNDSGDFVAVRSHKSGQSASELIPQCIANAVARLPIPKRMKWGEIDTEFIRPIHWIVLLHGDQVIPCNILSVDTGSTTKGHRFQCSKDLEVRSALNYPEVFNDHGFVIANRPKRRSLVEKQINQLAEEVKGSVTFSETDEFDAFGLVEEVTNLVEYPNAFLGTFDESFLKLPQEILVVSMRVHQKYFPVWHNGSLIPFFIGVANIDLSDSNTRKRVVNGNERVLRARLSDAKFFWDRDKKVSLEHRVEQLRGMIFHRSLGSIFEKMIRVRELAEFIAIAMTIDPSDTRQAADLAKADLVSEVVGEFPQLQGIMGRYLAAANGKPERVSRAIEEHYFPRSASDNRMPTSGESIAVALADRIDSLIGLIGVGETVTGDRDPYSLRRMAAAVARILVESKYELDVEKLLKKSASIYIENLSGNQNISEKFGIATISSVFNLILDRLRFYYIEHGHTADEIAAVLAQEPSEFHKLSERLHAVQRFKEQPECEELVAANKRIRNILRKSGMESDGSVDRELLTEDAEILLYEKTCEVSKQVNTEVAEAEPWKVLQRLTELKDPIDRFFDEVMVMVEDQNLRENRINLTGLVSKLFLQVADISLLHIDQKES